MRIITVYSTSGKTNVKIESTATTFGEFVPQLREQGFSLDGMKAVVGETKVTLEADSAVLPEGEFKLFLMPLKTKSGADMSRNDAYAIIQDFINRDGDIARNHFNANGNYTRTKTTELISLINSYSAPTSAATVAPVATSVNNAVTLISKEECEQLLEKLLDIDEDNLISNEVGNLVEARKIVENFIDRFDGVHGVEGTSNTSSLPPAQARVKTQEELEREAEQERERAEREALADEANELMNEFTDVRR